LMSSETVPLGNFASTVEPSVAPISALAIGVRIPIQSAR